MRHNHLRGPIVQEGNVAVVYCCFCGAYRALASEVWLEAAKVTDTCHDGSQWGWGNQPVIRYETADGSWAWIPGTNQVGDWVAVEAG